MHQFQTADRELIQTDVSIFLDTGNRGDMAYLRVLGLFEVLQDGTCRYHTSLQMIDTKALQVLDIEMAQEFLLRGLLCKHPVIELEGEVFRAKEPFKVLFPRPVVQDLLRREIAQEFLHVVLRTFARQELARGDIKEGHTKRGLAKVHSRQEVVLLVVQHVV